MRLQRTPKNVSGRAASLHFLGGGGRRETEKRARKQGKQKERLQFVQFLSLVVIRC